MVNVGKYIIHESYGYHQQTLPLESVDQEVEFCLMGCYEFDEWNLASAIALISLRNYNLEFRKQSMLEKNMK